VVRVTQTLLPRGVLTPARFDMMRIIEVYGMGGTGQQRIQDLLAVSAPTVSRMLKSLEGLGYVFRERMEHDARMKRVYLTPLGREIINAALLDLIFSGRADRMALWAFDCDGEKGRARVDTLRDLLCRLRENYFDSAPFEHPWTVAELKSFPHRYPHHYPQRCQSGDSPNAGLPASSS
jgi:DNA-binding MarR family transcriptional regulator